MEGFRWARPGDLWPGICSNLLPGGSQPSGSSSTPGPQSDLPKPNLTEPLPSFNPSCVPMDSSQGLSQPGLHFPFQACFSSPLDCWMVPECSMCVHTSRPLLRQGLLPGTPFLTWPIHPHSLSLSSNVQSSLKSFLSPLPCLKPYVVIAFTTFTRVAFPSILSCWTLGTLTSDTTFGLSEGPNLQLGTTRSRGWMNKNMAAADVLMGKHQAQRTGSSGPGSGPLGPWANSFFSRDLSLLLCRRRAWGPNYLQCHLLRLTLHQALI